MLLGNADIEVGSEMVLASESCRNPSPMARVDGDETGSPGRIAETSRASLGECQGAGASMAFDADLWLKFRDAVMRIGSASASL